MKKASAENQDADLRAEYDFSRGVRRKYAHRCRVAQAARLFRPATRRTERQGRDRGIEDGPFAKSLSSVPVGESPTGAGESPAPPIAGFAEAPGGKGSRRKFRHPKYAGAVILSGHEGDDARHYQEKQVRQAVREVQR